MVPWMWVGSLPTTSRMSISPQPGHPALPMSLPSIQKAGHIPWPAGTFTRAEKRPYACSKSPFVTSRADVYLQAPYQHDNPPASSSRATMWRRPSFWNEFFVLSV